MLKIIISTQHKANVVYGYAVCTLKLLGWEFSKLQKFAEVSYETTPDV